MNHTSATIYGLVYLSALKSLSPASLLRTLSLTSSSAAAPTSRAAASAAAAGDAAEDPESASLSDSPTRSLTVEPGAGLESAASLRLLAGCVER